MPIQEGKAASLYTGTFRHRRRPTTLRAIRYRAVPRRWAFWSEQVDLAAVGPGVAAGGVEFAPEGPGQPQRAAGQGGVEPADGDGDLLQGPDDPARDEQLGHRHC